MRTLQAIFDESEVDGVFGISLVRDPAMKGEFIALKKQKVQFATVDEEQRIVVGLVLEPNKLIPRTDGDGEAFNMVFDDNTVKNLCYAFTKNSHNKSSSIEHENKIQDVAFVENWIVRDDKIDTAVALGLEVKKGQWVSVAKIDNDEVWDDYIKTGKVLGFSIDAMLSLEEVNLKSNTTMSELKETLTSFKDDILTALNLNKKVEDVKIEFGSLKSADGQTLFEYEGDTPQIGGAVWVTAEDGTKVPVPVGEIPLEDGTILVVQEEGIIASVNAVDKPAEDENLQTDNTGGADVGNVMQQVQDSIKSIMIKYHEDVNSKFDDIQKQITEFQKENTSLKAEVTELSEQPASKPIQTISQIKLTQKGRLLNAIRQN